jgi:hypothetical protein
MVPCLRFVAALADRVAKERGESVGKVVGYSIHANRSTSRLTRVTFCTTGILIRRMMVDPELASVTHVIIDEVHERGLEVRTLDWNSKLSCSVANDRLAFKTRQIRTYVLTCCCCCRRRLTSC